MNKTSFISFLILIIILVPVIALGQTGPLVNTAECSGTDCGFDNFIKLVVGVMGFIILLSLPATAIVMAYAGFQMISAGDNAGKRSEAKDMLWKVVIGFIFILSAWLIVKAITSPLLQEGYVTI